MELTPQILDKLKDLTSHGHIQLTSRGNAAIKAAVSLIKGPVLIPEEGGWLAYQKIKNHQKVKCVQAKISLDNLKQKLSTNKFKALLYQNPGGYFAEQPAKEIYQLCRKHGCLVILDASGSIGTDLCNGDYADVIVCSFGKWKLIDARAGGFISCRSKELFSRVITEELTDPVKLKTILEKISQLQKRISFLTQKRKEIIQDLKNFSLVHPTDLGFVLVIKYKEEEKEEEKNKLIAYCQKNNLPFTFCPRYIRLNQPAISIEIKQLPLP